ncbi:protein containing Prepilin-type cleavage/methylation [Candidatus Magnetomorum sp. HK-1]|nr:protein containing Prepilin-type cleavage/methylation [Candidatus Magnetomorum sp. HK-1]
MNHLKLKTIMDSNAFTLIELLFVMAIFTTLAAIGVYSVNQYLPKQRQLSAARVVKTDLVKARIHAIKTRTNQTVTLQNSAYIIKQDSNVYIKRNFKEDFDWNGIEVKSDKSPTFNMDGTVDDITTIEVRCGDSDPLFITMTITGNIKIES